MKALSTVFVLLVTLAACSSDNGENRAIECWIVAPNADEVLSGEVAVQIGFEGPATSIELTANGEVVSSRDPSGADGSLTVELDTSEIDDGVVELGARASSEDGEGVAEPISVFIDNTAPVVSLDVVAMEIFEGDVEISVSIEEANISSVCLLSDHEGEITSVTEEVETLSWDTLNSESRLHRISLEVSDVAGNVTTTDEIPVIVGNNGLLLDQGELQYSPSAWVSIPDPFDSAAEIHSIVAASQTAAGADPEAIVRVVTWLTWDVEEDWAFEYSLGQGICPHRGVAYDYEESDDGLAVIDIAWTEVPATQQEAALVHDPSHPEDAVTFPYNADPATCGSFFGHVAALEPESHAGERISFQTSFFFIFGEE
jgi:hypothetical protein